jgi:hypothetical protein
VSVGRIDAEPVALPSVYAAPQGIGLPSTEILSPVTHWYKTAYVPRLEVLYFHDTVNGCDAVAVDGALTEISFFEENMPENHGVERLMIWSRPQITMMIKMTNPMIARMFATTPGLRAGPFGRISGAASAIYLL